MLYHLAIRAQLALANVKMPSFDGNLWLPSLELHLQNFPLMPVPFSLPKPFRAGPGLPLSDALATWCRSPEPSLVIMKNLTSRALLFPYRLVERTFSNE